MFLDEESVKKMLAEALLEEKAKRIKTLLEKGVSEPFIMEVFELDKATYRSIYNRLFPFGRYTGPFGKHVEKDIKIRILKKIGYTEGEAQELLDKHPLFLPKEIERRMISVAMKDAYTTQIQEFLEDGKSEEWIRDELFLTKEDFLSYKLEIEKD